MSLCQSGAGKEWTLVVLASPMAASWATVVTGKTPVISFHWKSWAQHGPCECRVPLVWGPDGDTPEP